MNEERGRNTPAADQLRSIMERVERLKEEGKAINQDIAECYAEARANGFDVKTIKRCIAQRAKDPHQREEEDALFELYWDSIQGASRARAREEQEMAPPEAPVEEQEQPPLPEEETISVTREGGEASDPKPTASPSPPPPPPPPPPVLPVMEADELPDVPSFLDRRKKAAAAE
jgi:uncharacterized protein (UPF0335 family)